MMPSRIRRTSAMSSELGVLTDLLAFALRRTSPGHFAPSAIHWRSVAIDFLSSGPPLLAGGISVSSSFARLVNLYSPLFSGLNGMITGISLPALNAVSRDDKSRSPSVFSPEWHDKQFVSRIGCTSRTKSTAPAALQTAADDITSATKTSRIL